MNIAVYRDQHAKALSFVSEIVPHLESAEAVKQHAGALRLSLSKLLGVLKSHLASEDTFLYPRLMNDPDPKVSETAKAYWNEMGNLAPKVVEFVDKWRQAGTIEKEPAVFIRECQAVFAALGSRIEREEKLLYPLFKANNAA